MYISQVRIKGYLSKFYKQYEFGGILLLGLSVLMIVASCIISYRFITTIQPLLDLATPEDKLDVSATGMIGDFIGGVVGPILSFVGVLLFFLALRLQSKELGLQIKELAETREVFTIQQFENTFFNLLQAQQDLRLNIEVEVDETPTSTLTYYINGNPPPRVMKTYKSSAFFELVKEDMFSLNKRVTYLYGEIKALDDKSSLTEEEEQKKEDAKKLLIREADVSDYTVLDTPRNIAKVTYKSAYIKYGSQLGHYFRNLYHILSYLEENEQRELNYTFTGYKDDSGIIDPVKFSKEFRYKYDKVTAKYKKYSEFIQAQMSATELFLLFYNSLFFSKMRRLMYHFDFLENINSDDLLIPDVDKHLYNKCKINGVNYPSIVLKSKEELLKI